MAKAASTRMRLFSPPNWTSNLKEQLVECCIGNLALYGVETWKLKKLDQKYLGGLEMWRGEVWRRSGEPIV
jgi:hypothetical protein